MTERETRYKVFENKLRRIAKRRGFLLVKNRRRDPLANDFGKFAIYFDDGSGIALPGKLKNRLYSHSLRQAARFILSEYGEPQLQGIFNRLEGRMQWR